MILNCIAVDDEPLALALINSYIEQTPFLSLSGSYASAVEALRALHEQQIDVIFLDIQMPDLSGIELARVLDQRLSKARIIFTTAFDQYALEGYRVDALDYLLKPFNYPDFLRAADKALKYAELITTPKTIETSPNLAKNQDDEYLFLKVEYQLVKVPFRKILFIESLKDYVKVHLEGEEKAILTLTTLKTLNDKLPASMFMRIHRSYIIALDKIKAVTRNSVQIGKVIISVSDQYRESFNEFIDRRI